MRIHADDDAGDGRGWRNGDSHCQHRRQHRDCHPVDHPGQDHDAHPVDAITDKARASAITSAIRCRQASACAMPVSGAADLAAGRRYHALQADLAEGGDDDEQGTEITAARPGFCRLCLLPR